MYRCYMYSCYMCGHTRTNRMLQETHKYHGYVYAAALRQCSTTIMGVAEVAVQLAHASKREFMLSGL